jgi:hypothetical protein
MTWLIKIKSYSSRPLLFAQTPQRFPVNACYLFRTAVCKGLNLCGVSETGIVSAAGVDWQSLRQTISIIVFPSEGACHATVPVFPLARCG